MKPGLPLRPLRFRFDMPLFAGLVVLCATSIVILFSAGGADSDQITRQLIRIGLALVLMLAVAQLSPSALMRYSPVIYSIGLAMLIAVLAVGFIGKGAQRWLDLGLFRFQPSEIMKLAVPMMVAWTATRKFLPLSIWHITLCFVVIIVPAALIGVQPDLGTALLVTFAGLVVIFLAGISWKFIASILGILAVTAPLVWQFIFHDYQRTRVLTLFDPWKDPLGAGYHTIQSMIAIGSGGRVGKGWLQGTQAQLEFIPERSTDFIFSVFGEEFGLIGFLFLLSIYLFLVLRGTMIAFYAQETYDRLLAGSVILTFMFYVFVNIGMVSGILPVVGVPLPLVSYGGTSMLTLMVGFGILMSVQCEGRKLSRS
jgi:rod shape determining protein RodA